MQLQAELAVLLSRSSIVVLLLFSVFFPRHSITPHTPTLSSHLLCFFLFFFWNVPVRFFHALGSPLLCVCVCVCMHVCIYILYVTNPPHKHLFFGESSQIDRLLSQVVV